MISYLYLLLSAVAIQQQRDCLVTFYTQTNGDNWFDNTNWLSNKSYCDWYGVVCDTNNWVTELHLQNNNMTYTAFDFAPLEKLRTVDFDHNFNKIFSDNSAPVGNNFGMIVDPGYVGGDLTNFDNDNDNDNNNDNNNNNALDLSISGDGNNVVHNVFNLNFNLNLNANQNNNN
jgi:hypothetical protein